MLNWTSGKTVTEHSIDSLRILTAKSVDEYFGLAQRSNQKVLSSPVSEIEFDPSADEISLVVAWSRTLPSSSQYPSISITQARTSGGDIACRITIKAADRRHESYMFLMSVLGAVANGHSMSNAFEGSVRKYRGLIARSSLESSSSAIGLLGELLVLELLFDSVGYEKALDSWIASGKEEHDFRFKEYDLEVKTTRREIRQHRISSLTQLEGRPGIPLSLCSVQVTAGGAGGLSLATLENKLAARSRDLEFHFRKQIALRRDEILEPLSWTSRWVLRSPIVVIPIDDDFPAITRNILREAGIQLSSIDNVAYDVDVSALVTSPRTVEIDKWLKKMKESTS